MTDRTTVSDWATTEAVSDGRHLGLAGATGIGVGAMVITVYLYFLFDTVI